MDWHIKHCQTTLKLNSGTFAPEFKFRRARTPIVSFNNYRNMDANKSIEQRIEELESLVYASKNVLSFDEASKFLSLSKS